MAAHILLIREKRNEAMKRVCGFALFFIAVGILIGNYISNQWCDAASVVVCVSVGYYLFFV